MNRGLYTAYTGMLAQQQRMDTISNNLANTNTNGFKKDGVVFQSFDEVYMLKVNPANQVNTIGKASLGVKVGNIYTDYQQGSFEETNNPLHIALNGTGMIAVGQYDQDGNILTKYTRDGSFTLDGNGRLMTTDGYFVMGEDGPITIDSGNIVVNESGQVYQKHQLVDQIKIVDFEDLRTLKKIGAGLYETTEASELKEFNGRVIQGFVEKSNVNSVDEMVNMINLMRTYESNQKVISTYDETLSKAVNDVGRL